MSTNPRSPRRSSGPSKTVLMCSNDFGEIDMTVANNSSFEVKNCITSDGLTPASDAIRLIVVAAKPSAANRAQSGVEDLLTRCVRAGPPPAARLDRGLGFRGHPKNLPREQKYEQALS